MDSSRAFITIFLAIFIPTIAFASAPCDKNGQCMYGGVCGSDRTCRCQINCVANWKTNLDSIYCLPDGKIFFNICEVLNKACELQKDIPLIKFDIAKRRCPAHKAREEKLCPAPEDFMGSCGGTINRQGPYDAGVCLKNRKTGKRRCECPKERKGENCDIKNIVFRSVEKVNPTQSGGNRSDSILGASVGAAIGAGVLLVIIFVFLRYRRSPRARDAEKQECASSSKISDSSNSRNQSSRTNRIQASGVESSNHSCTISVPSLSENETTFTPADYKNLAAQKRASKRQRLIGISGDANNNTGNSQLKGDSQACKIKPSQSTPEVEFCLTDEKFCEGFSEESCRSSSVHTF